MDLSITTLILLVLTPRLVWRVYTRIKARMVRQTSRGVRTSRMRVVIERSMVQ